MGETIMIIKYVLPLLALVALAFTAFFVVTSNPAATEEATTRQPALKIPGAVLAGTGIVEPVGGNIAVGSPLPGVVAEVIDSGEIGKVVKKDTLLFRLDDRNLKADLEVKKAALGSSKAQLVRLEKMPRKEELAPLEWKLEELKHDVMDAQKLLDAANMQGPKGAISKADWGKYKANYQIVLAQQAKAKADLDLLKAGTWQPDLDVARAAVVQTQTQVEQAETELKRLEVRARQTCTLLQVNVRIGEFVGAQPNQNLILIGDLKHLYVRVDVDEHDAPRFRPSMSAVGYLRGQPDVAYPMEYVRTEPYLVPRKSLTGDISERVDTRVLQVIYQIKEKEGNDIRDKIYVGQQLDVLIGELNTVPQKKPATNQP
jgi:HlyD family secretion protein